jgi:plasmid maintenance system antidote protein VapI
MSAQFWLNLQTAYDIRLANEKSGEEISKLPQSQFKLDTAIVA